MKAHLLLFIIAAFIIPGAVHPQAKTKRDKAVVVEANLTVLDSAGKIVENLKPENVKILEDGVEQKIDVLERKAPGLTLGIAIDNSASTKFLFERIVQAATAIVNELGSNEEVFLVRFVSSEKIEVVEEFTSDKALLVNALKNGMYIEGGQSAVIDAVYLSMGRLMEKESSGRNTKHALILLSDGDERSSFYTTEQLFAFISKSNAQIFPLAFTGSLDDSRNELGKKQSRTKAERLVSDLAFSTGGTAHILGNRAVEADLLTKLRDIMTELRYPYVVRYVSTNQKRDGSTRTLRVEVADGPNGEKRTGKTRETFIVPKD